MAKNFILLLIYMATVVKKISLHMDLIFKMAIRIFIRQDFFQNF